MVRIVSNGFSTPRSRHSSGEEMIDRFSALRAISALHESDHSSDEDTTRSLKTGTLVIACDTDTNDSFSAPDSEEDSRTSQGTGGDSQQSGGEDIVTKRKQRRRERNKISAQHYRQRRREQSGAAEKMLGTLETKHKMLLEKVRHLEAEKHIVEEYLKNCVKIPWCPYHQPCSRPIISPTTPCAGPMPTMPMSMPVSMRSETPVESGSTKS